MERVLKNILGVNGFADVSKKRSAAMASVRGKNNKSTELRLKMALVRHGVSGWILHARNVPGKPDFFFQKERIAIFVDGCFWHGCPTCGHVPKTRTPFWQMKFQRNKERDERNNSRLLGDGIITIRLWEHQIKDSNEIQKLIIRLKDAKQK